MNVTAQQFIAKIINNNHTQSKVQNSVILFIEPNIKASYSGTDTLYFEDNKYENSMTQTLNTFTITSLNQTSTNISSNSVTDLNDVTNAGSGLIITGAERTLISTNQTNVGNKHNTIDSSNRLDASFIGSNGNVSNTEYGYLSGVTSDIQTQINAIGGSHDHDDEHHVFFSGEQGVTTFNMDNEIQSFIWSRSAGYSSGTTITTFLPTSPTNHQIINLHSFNLESHDAGTWNVEIPSSHNAIWRNSAFDSAEITKINDKKLAITKPRRNSYIVFYYTYGNDNYWYFKAHSPLYESIRQSLSVQENFTVTAASSNPAKINIISEIGLQADSQSQLEFVVDRSNNGYDHKTTLEMTEHGNFRVLHNKFFSTNPVITEVARFTKNQCLLIPGSNQVQSSINSYDNSTWAPAGISILDGELRLYNSSSSTNLLLLKNLPTSAPSDPDYVWNDGGTLKIS